jgi:hypothetical protein
MKEYFKYNFQYLLVAIFFACLAIHNLIVTANLFWLISCSVISMLSIVWSIYNYCDVFVIKRRI